MSSEFVLLNEKFYLKDEPLILFNNRAFCYGDALFETIHCLGTQPQYLELHLNRLVKGMKVLKMQISDNMNFSVFHKHIEKLLNKNRIFKGARIRITVFRDQGGRYSPEKNSFSWLMESSILDNEQFKLETKGQIIDIYDELHKPVNILSNLKTTNSLIYILAGIFRTENRLDDCLILNQYGRICESISSNVFMARDNKIITPPLSEGCIEGTVRQTIMALAKEIGYEVEEKGILEKNLLEADEVILTNAIQGVKWVSAYKDRRYYNFISRKLIAALNQKTFII
jgi:branched-subunit amino acid aminotransferase/4-amino-4-deoxychorismate lyase